MLIGLVGFVEIISQMLKNKLNLLTVSENSPSQKINTMFTRSSVKVLASRMSIHV